MGTRGIYGFHKNNVDKLTYKHYDSYFEGLGDKIVDFIRNTSIEEMEQIFSKITLVSRFNIPNIEQILNCIEFVDLMVSFHSLSDFYCLLRKTQGDLSVYNKSNLKYMVDYKDQINNTYMCEYAYIINLDEEIFEIYYPIGKDLLPNRYFNKEMVDRCNLIKTYSLKEIPENWKKECNDIVKMYTKKVA